MRLLQAFTATCLLLGSAAVWPQDANLKKTLADRLPSLPKIEEISKTPMPGVLKFVCRATKFFTAMPKVIF